MACVAFMKRIQAFFVGLGEWSFQIDLLKIYVSTMPYLQNCFCNTFDYVKSHLNDALPGKFSNALAYGTRARSARGSQNRAILSIICPFTGNRAFRLCVNDIVVDLPRRKDATKVFIREVSTTKYIINMVLPSSYT